MYHRVDEDENDPFKLVVHPKRFREHLRRLQRLADVVALRDAWPLASGLRPRVAITFDDGYIDNLHNALPELEREGLPATFFVISDGLGDTSECWWDQLEQIFRSGWEGSRQIRLPIRDCTLTGEVYSDLSGLLELHSFLLPLRGDEIQPMIDLLRDQLGYSSPTLERRLMNVEELRALASGSGVEIGAHTRTHPSLADLDRDDQSSELAGSRERLRELVGTDVTTVSYPFGSHNGDTIACARSAGFEVGCTVEAAPVRSSSDPLELPRFAVENWDGYEFEQVARRWIEQAQTYAST